ncbi:hypothetical protein Tco_1539888 [Tanacetum coccineum]
MSNPNTNKELQTQTSSALHNDIMEAGGKDRPPMLAPGNYVQWKSRIKRYIDTKPNNECIHYCLQNPPYKFKWNERSVPIAEGSSEIITEGFMKSYKTVSDEIRSQLDAEAEAVQIILTWIDNDIYSTVDACPNACEMWKAIERLKQGESINVQDLETNLYCEFGKFTSRDGESFKSYYLRFYKMMNELIKNKCDVTSYQVNVQFLLQLQPQWQRFVTLVKQSQELKTILYHKLYDILKQHQNEANEIRAERLACAANLLALVAQQQLIYKPTNNILRTSSNTSRVNHDNSPRIDRGTGYDNQRAVNVARAKANVGTQVVYQSGIQSYNYKEYGHVARECQKPKRRDDTDDEQEDQELEAHYMYMAQIQEVSPNAAENSRTVFDEPFQKVQYDDDNYNVFANDREHPEQPESINDTYSMDMSPNGGEVDHDVDDDLASECDLLASLIERLKCEIDDTNNELSKTNQMMFKDIKKFQNKLDRYHDVNYASKVELDCAKAKGELIAYKMSSEKSFNEYTRKINDLKQTISDMKQELVAHQEKLSIISHEKETQKQFYKTREDKEIEKIIALENKVKFLKKAQRVNPRLYDIGCYNDNLALILAPEFDDSIRLAQESRSKLSDLIKPFDYKKLNDLYDLFVPQREKLAEQQFFSERSKISLTPFRNGTSKESFNKQKTLLETRMDETISWDKKCKSSKELRKIKSSVDMIFNGVEQEKVKDLRYFNSLEHEVDSLKSQLETQKTQFLNEIDRLSREYYYADHITAILGVYTQLDEVTNLQCDYNEAVEKCQRLEKELSKGNITSKSFEALQTHAINLEIALQQYLKAQLQDKGIAISELEKLIEKLKGKSVETKFEKSLVIRQLNALKSQRQSILRKRATFSYSLAKKDFSKPVTAQIIPQNVKSGSKNTNVISPGMSKQPIDVPISVNKPKCSMNQSVATSLKKIVASESTNKNPRKQIRKLNEHVSKTSKWWYSKISPPGYQWKPKNSANHVKPNLIEIIMFIVNSGCSKHMTGNLKLLSNFVEKFIGTVKFGNDQIAPILGYGDLVQGKITIKRVYYVEGLNYNLFSVGQFCDADLEVAFQKSTCYIRDLKGNDLLTGSRGLDFYSITLQDTTTPNPICLMAKAT